MAGTMDGKQAAAEVGRTALYKSLSQFAGMNLMERSYQSLLMDLQAKRAIDGMAKEVADLHDAEKFGEVLSRFIVVIVMQVPKEQQPHVVFQLYTHLRATGLMEPVKPNIGSIVDATGKRIPPKEGT